MYTSPTKAAIALIAATLLSQGAVASWANHGAFEPDNAEDDPQFMWTDPPVAVTNRVYFNAYSGMAPGLRGALLNPNVAALQTTNEAPTVEYHMAILGVWSDCNGDGYVGLAETAALEYPAALLSDLTICPAVTGDINAWPAGAHNYNGWVTEYVPIGGRSDVADNGNDSRVYIDDAAMVWGDNGLHTDAATAGGSCALAPQPRGTFQSTGGFINWIECNPALLERWNDAWNGRRLAGQDIPGITPLTGQDPGLDFNDPNNASGTYADVQTFGSEDTANTPVTVWDCDAAPAFHSGETINATFGPNAATVYSTGRTAGLTRLDSYTVYEAEPTTTGNADPRFLPSFVNSTQEGLNVASANENCDTSDDDGHDFYGNNYVFYVGETDFNSVSVANKRAASWNLQFVDSGRGQVDVVTIGGQPYGTGPYPIFGGRAGAAAPSLLGSNWNSPSVLLKNGPRTIRTDQAAISDGRVEVNAPTTFTFYAHVGPATTARGLELPPGRGVYAEPQCGDEDSGIIRGWNCDPATWYRNPDGSAVPEPYPFARPGQAYQFRDTDCYDGRNAAGVAIGVTAYGAAPCEPFGG